MNRPMVVTADWHLRWEVPRCRRETQREWLDHQRKAMAFAVDVANARDADLYIVGDLFHKNRSRDILKVMFIEAMVRLRGTCYLEPGNHDQLHGKDDLEDTSFGVIVSLYRRGLALAPIEDAAAVVHYGQADWVGVADSPVLFKHVQVYESDAACPPGVHAITARALLKQYPDHRIIVTGDMHRPFLHESGGRYVVNCGCLTKQAVDTRDYALRVWCISTQGAITFEPLPDDRDLVDDTYIVAEHERDERMGAFLESLERGGDITLSFEDNVEKALAASDLRDGTRLAVRELMDA